MSLYESFSLVEDPRRAKGRRTTMEQIFCMLTISYLCGYMGYRPAAKFAKAQEAVLVRELGLKHGVPSHVTFRDVLKRVKEEQVIAAFNQWAKGYVEIQAGDWLSGDGKALRSTAGNAHSAQQDFQAIVSVFCHKSGLVLRLEQYRNAKKSEQEVVRSLITELQGGGLILRMDALHTQKND